MDMKTEIICKDFKHKKILENKIIVDEPSEEYYIIPLNKGFELEYDKEVYKLTFHNQLLWLKYSNRKKEILLKEKGFTECVLIKSENILDIYMNILCHECFKKNVWHSNYNVNVNKKYKDKYFLVIPIIDEMIDIHEYGIGIKNYQIHMISNEIIMRKVKLRSEHGGNIIITNNIMLNKEALFIRLNNNDVKKFSPSE